MSSLFVVVVGLFVVVVAHDVDAVALVHSRAAARRLLRLSLEVARSLQALQFRLDAANHSAVCYVIEQVSDVTAGDVTETESWYRRPVNIPLQLVEYRRKPSSTPSAHVCYEHVYYSHKQHKKIKRTAQKTAIYSLAYIYIKQVVGYTKSTAERCGINTVLNILSLV